MTEPLESLMDRLRAEYLDEVPRRLEEIRDTLGEYAAGGDGAGERLQVLFHRLAGSSGAYGFGQVTEHCRAAERLLSASELHETQAPRLRGLIGEIQEGFGLSA